MRTTDDEAPLIVHAKQDEDRERVLRETSGGVLFTDAEDMPSLERLLEQHRISYAVLEGPPVGVDTVDMAPPISGDWRGTVRSRLDHNVAISDRDAVMDEEYSFMAALGSDSLDAFLNRAMNLLADATVTEEQWDEFLEKEAEAADSATSHAPLSLEDSVEEDAEAAPPTLTLEDLAISFSRGAMGAPRPLADLSER